MTAPQPAPAGVDALCVGSRKAADMLGVDERTVIRWADEGTLEVAYRTRGGHRRFRVEHVRHVADALAREES